MYWIEKVGKYYKVCKESRFWEDQKMGVYLAESYDEALECITERGGELK